MKVKHLINEILKNSNKKRNERLVSKLLSYEWSYEQYLRCIFVVVSFVSGIFQLKKLSTVKYISHQTFLKPYTNAQENTFNEDRYLTAEEKENKDVVPNTYTSQAHYTLDATETDMSDTTTQYSTHSVVVNPLKNLQECLTEQDTTLNVLGGVFSNIQYIKTGCVPDIGQTHEHMPSTGQVVDTPTHGATHGVLKEESTPCNSIPWHGCSHTLVFPYSRYAIIEEQSGPLYCITKPLQFYSNLLPLWMVTELIIGLNSRKRASYIIRRINCWNNSKRLEDIVGINQISESINKIIYSLNKEKVTFFIPKFLNDACNHAMRSIGVHTDTPNTSKTRYEAPKTQNYLFVGPSGTGKTVLAQAIAGSSGVSMFCTTLSELQSSSLTTGPAHLRTLFQKAKIHKPSLIVLENLELIGQIRRESTTYLDIQLFTELLVALTPRNTSHVNSEYSASPIQSAKLILKALCNPNIYNGITVEPNILIGTTDTIEKLDPALIRPGRFNCVIYFSYPNTKDRVRLLTHFTIGYQRSESVGLPVQLWFNVHPNTSCVVPRLKYTLEKHPYTSYTKQNALLYYFARKTIHYTHAHLYVLVNESKLQSILQFFMFNLPWFIIQNSHFRIKNRVKSNALYMYRNGNKQYQPFYGKSNRMNIFIKRYTHKIAKYNKITFCVIILAVIFVQRTFSFVYNIVFNGTYTYTLANTKLYK